MNGEVLDITVYHNGTGVSMCVMADDLHYYGTEEVFRAVARLLGVGPGMLSTTRKERNSIELYCAGGCDILRSLEKQYEEVEMNDIMLDYCEILHNLRCERKQT